MQYEGNWNFLIGLRKAAREVLLATAQRLGTGVVMAGSYLAKKILESLPEPTSVHDTPPSNGSPHVPAHRPHTGSRRAA